MGWGTKHVVVRTCGKGRMTRRTFQSNGLIFQVGYSGVHQEDRWPKLAVSYQVGDLDPAEYRRGEKAANAFRISEERFSI